VEAAYKDGVPASPPLPEDELNKIFMVNLSSRKKPVTRNGKPFYFVRSGENGAEHTIYLLTVGTQDARKAALSYLSDFERLFDPSAENIPFSVEVFSLMSNGSVQTESLEAGDFRLLNSYSQLPFPQGHNSPHGLSLVFPDAEGQRNIWLLFSGGKHSLFSFYERTNTRALIKDIDRDGMFDLLLFEDIFEDSSGYETYITWHKWDGATFVKHRSTNTIRRLRSFFESSRQLLLARSWQRFFDYTLLPQEAQSAETQDPAQTFRRFFRLQDDAVPQSVSGPSVYEILFPREIEKSLLSGVVLPNVVENPFPLGKDGPRSFPFTIRINSAGDNHFFSARLAMPENPFDGKMFYFLPSD
jgi:hypothetical protein